MSQTEVIGSRKDTTSASSSTLLGTSVGSAVGRRTLGSVVVPAHNEAAVIRRCLDALFDGIARDDLEVVVVCNGCRDTTAALARNSGHSVQVVELATASKAAALRAGDAVARTFPRLYLDADVVLPGQSARRILEHLAGGAVAARPPIHYETRRATALVRGYYRARSQMPAVLGSLWGAGVYGVSAAGRRRFDVFPDLGADDLWIDSQFDPSEIDVVACDPVSVTVPRASRDLFRALRRTYRGKKETRGGAVSVQRSRATTLGAVGDLARLCTRSPMFGLDAAIYISFAIGARILLAVAKTGPAPGEIVWERDETSRWDVA
jgi:glycosyltransferase involved in cell wall biosynthesis